MNTAIILDSNDPEICYQSKRKSRFIIATFLDYSVVLPRDTYSIKSLQKNPFEIVLYNFSAYTPGWMKEANNDISRKHQ